METQKKKTPKKIIDHNTTYIFNPTNGQGISQKEEFKVIVQFRLSFNGTGMKTIMNIAGLVMKLGIHYKIFLKNWITEEELTISNGLIENKNYYLFNLSESNAEILIKFNDTIKTGSKLFFRTNAVNILVESDKKLSIE